MSRDDHAMRAARAAERPGSEPATELVTVAGGATASSRHRTWVQVDLAALQANLGTVRRHVAAGVGVMGVVKADAYGHGLVEVSRALVEGGVETLGVATVDEAVTLREAGVHGPLVILDCIFPEDAEAVVAYGATQTVCDLAVPRALSAAAAHAGRAVRVHLKVDTGMGRIGVAPTELATYWQAVEDLARVQVDGVYTHLAQAEDPARTAAQLQAFQDAVTAATSRGRPMPLCHVANSAGTLLHRAAQWHAVRPGLILYGLRPQGVEAVPVVLRPVLEFRTRVVFLKRVPAGTAIGYGGTHVTAQETVIATLPVGYGDGYPLGLSNRGQVLIRGRRAPVVGRVCMDQLMVDVGGIAGVVVGEEVVLIGTSGDERITVEELAARAGTIPYQVVCGITPRAPRIYRAVRPADP